MTKLTLKYYPQQDIYSYVNSFITDDFNRTCSFPFSDFLKSSFDSFNTRFYNLNETENEYIVSIDLPGFEQKEINVEIDKFNLIVSAKNEKRGEISQSIILPQDVDPEKLKAEFKNGVLTISANKLQKYKKKKIEIG